MRATTLIMVCVCLMAIPAEAKIRHGSRRNNHQSMQGDQGANLRLDNNASDNANNYLPKETARDAPRDNNSAEAVWWRCPKCGQSCAEWQANTLPNYWTCPSCGEKFYDAESKSPRSSGRGTRRAAAPDRDRGVAMSGTEARVIAAVNKYRDGYGLAPLKADPALMLVGRNAAPYFSHVINGKWCWTRAHEAGFPGWATDDIAEGYESPEDAVQGWATSDGHAHQMRGDFNMNGAWRNYHFNRIGVGISGRKYIAVFGRRD